MEKRNRLDMNEFSRNLSEVLAHSVVFFAREQSKGTDCYAWSSSTTTQGSGQTGTETTAEQMMAFAEHLPAVMAATNQELLPSELAKFETSQSVSPLYAQLQQDLYGQYGPSMNKIGSDIANQNALAQAQTDADVLAGPGKELIANALEGAKLYDPEYFSTRELAAQQMQDMLRPGLTGGEHEAIQRYVNQNDVATGNLNAGGGASNVVSNAMQFGNAARDRMSQSLSLATGMLPTLRSNVDTFQQATGRPSMVNTGEGRTQGAATNVGQNAYGMAGQFLGESGANARQGAQLNSSSTTTTNPSMFSNITSGLKTAASIYNPFG